MRVIDSVCGGVGGAADAEKFARQASLVYVSDSTAGIGRRRRGRGFAFLSESGHALRDDETLARIRSLAIPPAWTDVWICPDPEGHLQATGRDQRGRKQYKYHERWSAIRDEKKYSSLVEFARALPDIRARLDADLRRPKLPRERVIASIVWLLDNTMIRVGNAAYARDNKSFGLTTLRSRHLVVEGSRLRFRFKGKSGQEWNLRVTDRRMAKIMRGIQELPGQHLFQYIDDEGARRAVRSQDVNAYIREAAGDLFSSKHFRTWGGTVRAATLLADTQRPDTKAGRARAMNAAVDQVARHLGNTRAVSRACYIHPQVMTSWTDGRLERELEAAGKSRRKPPDGLTDEEALVLRWLEARNTR